MNEDKLYPPCPMATTNKHNGFRDICKITGKTCPFYIDEGMSVCKSKTKCLNHFLKCKTGIKYEGIVTLLVLDTKNFKPVHKNNSHRGGKKKHNKSKEYEITDTTNEFIEKLEDAFLKRDAEKENQENIKIQSEEKEAAKIPDEGGPSSDDIKSERKQLFENIEKVIRQCGNLRIEEARYGNDIIVCMDIITHINNATNKKDATLCYVGTEIYDAVNTMISPGDTEAVAAEERLGKYAELHPEFLYARGNTLFETLKKLEEKALLWNNLTSGEQDKILLDFVATKDNSGTQAAPNTIPGQMRLVNTDMEMEEE